MLIKTADDKQRRLRLLEDLQSSPLLDARQREWLQDERGRFQRGQQGEREAAHYIDHWKKDSEHHAVLHDLRFVVEGETAQIDHLVISRTLHFFLFETQRLKVDEEPTSRANESSLTQWHGQVSNAALATYASAESSCGLTRLPESQRNDARVKSNYSQSPTYG